jgi:hypothetical protein
MHNYFTDYTKTSAVNTNWGEFVYHTYGAEYGKSTRVVYGSHVLFGNPKINYKFINTNYTT